MARLLTLAIGMVVLASLLPMAVSAAPRQRCFVETGYCVSGPILNYWERNGGLPIFGYPISEQRTETVEGTWTGPVQWFERDRLEDHSAQGQGVLAGRLGARLLELRGAPWQTFPPAPAQAIDPKQCRFFPETNHTLCGRFRTYWERNGGLERFGYPITDAFSDSVEDTTYTVQYFERRRMEYHPENAGTKYEVLLGLLGRDVLRQDNFGWAFSPAPKYVPLAPATRHEGAAQRFEHGFMLWTKEPDKFYIFQNNGPYWIANAPYSFQPGQPVTDQPPPGWHAPTSGFGRIWRGEMVPQNFGPNQLPIVPRTFLGWAIEPEQPYTTEFQCHGGASYAEQRCYMRGPGGETIWFGPQGWGYWY